jgi:cyclopropane fatty-acyl-phospholipid synthase-like methyltransferase
MTHWDDIYKNYEKGGEAWATLAEEVHPLFMQFLERTEFPIKHALDIGCGTGKYLKVLHDRGFAVDGIDNSETAARMTKELIPSVTVFVDNMYQWIIPEDAYDLIVSVSTIQHGMKEDVAALIDRIYTGLTDGGSIFITLPSWSDERKEKMKDTHDVLAPGTLAPRAGPEAGLAHSFYTEEEIRDLFKDFRDLHFELDEYKRWVITGRR